MKKDVLIFKKSIEKYVTIDELEMILSVIAPFFVPFFLFATMSGLSLREQISIKKKNISDEWILINKNLQNDMKNRRWDITQIKDFKIYPKIRNIIEEQIEISAHFNSEYLFVDSNGQVLTPYKINKIWKKALIETGMKYKYYSTLKDIYSSMVLTERRNPTFAEEIDRRHNTAVYHYEHIT